MQKIESQQRIKVKMQKVEALGARRSKMQKIELGSVTHQKARERTQWHSSVLASMLDPELKPQITNGQN